MSHTRIETWCGYNIRFIETNNEWKAIFDDVRNALNLNETDVADLIEEGFVDVYENWQVIDEEGIYAAIFISDHPRAQATRAWLGNLLSRHGAHLLDHGI